MTDDSLDDPTSASPDPSSRRWSGSHSPSTLDRLEAGAIGAGNAAGRTLDSLGEGIGWVTDKATSGLSRAGVVSPEYAAGVHQRRLAIAADLEAGHRRVDEAHAGSTAYAVGGLAEMVGEVVVVEVATAGAGSGVAAGVLAARSTRAAGVLAKVPGLGRVATGGLEAAESGAVAARAGGRAAQAAGTVAGTGARAGSKAVGGLAHGEAGAAEVAALERPAAGAATRAASASSPSIAKGASAVSKLDVLYKVGHGAWDAAKGTTRFVGKTAGRVGGAALGAGANFAGGVAGGARDRIGRSLGDALGGAAMLFALYEAYELLVKYMRGNDGVNGGEGVHASPEVAKANAERARGDLAATLDPTQGPAGGRAAAPAVDRFGSVASAAVPSGILDGAKREAYGLGRIQPAGSINFDQTAKITNVVNGRPVTTVLPFLRGAGDGDTLQRSAEWWNGQAAHGFVPPIAEGSSITIGQDRTARSYVVKDGRFANVGDSLGASLPANARELSPADLARASSSPGLSSGGVLAAGLGGSDARALDETTRGRVFASVDPDGARRITATEVPSDGRGRSVFSLAVPKVGEGVMSASRFSTVGSTEVEDVVHAPAGRSIGLDGTGRITADRSALERAAGVGRVVGGDDLTRGLGLRQGSARIERTLAGAGPASAAVTFQGRDPGGFPVGGSLSVQRGKATFQVMGPDGHTPAWSRTVADEGFSVGPDGKVALSGEAKEMTAGFLSDPRGEARRMEGLAHPGAAMDRMLAIDPSRSIDRDGLARSGASLGSPGRGVARSPGLER